MKLSQVDSSFNQILNQSSQLKITGEFYLNQSRFIIIPRDKLSKTALLSNDIAQEQVVGQLQLDGKSYAIAKQQKLREPQESNLALILTARELQIASLVAQGKSNKQIAQHLQISKWTVSTHLRRIFMKLQVDNRAAMVYKCFGNSVPKNYILN